MQATNAVLLVNNVTVSSATNTIEDAIPGTTLTVLRKSTETVGISVTETTDVPTSWSRSSSARSMRSARSSTSRRRRGRGVARDPLLRSLRNELRGVLTGEYAAGGPIASLGQAGIEFDRTGNLTINQSLLSKALSESPDNLRALFLGDGTNPGVFETLRTTIEHYTDPGACCSDAGPDRRPDLRHGPAAGRHGRTAGEPAGGAAERVRLPPTC